MNRESSDVTHFARFFNLIISVLMISLSLPIFGFPVPPTAGQYGEDILLLAKHAFHMGLLGPA
jgi:hypothetical protein